MILINLKNFFVQFSKLFALIALLVLVGCSSTPFMQNNIAATKYLLDNFVEDAGGNILGVGVLVDRSNGTVTLHNNQYSIVKLDAVSYGEDEVPDELDKIPIQKPGSRHLK